MLFRVYVLDCLIEFMNEVVHIYNNSINIEERPTYSMKVDLFYIGRRNEKLGIM